MDSIEAHDVPLIHSSCLKGVCKETRRLCRNHAVIDCYGDLVGQRGFGGSDIPLFPGILRCIQRKLRCGAPGEQHEAADGEQILVHDVTSVLGLCGLCDERNDLSRLRRRNAGVVVFPMNRGMNRRNAVGEFVVTQT